MIRIVMMEHMITDARVARPRTSRFVARKFG